MDLNRWEFGHAGIFIRSLARVQLRDQLVGCNAPPAVFQKQQPKTSAEVLACCFASAKRCEADLDLDRLRDTLLDVLILRPEDLKAILKQDAAFQDNEDKTIDEWEVLFPLMGESDSKGI